MATYTWTGASGTDWSVAGAWSPAGGPPGIADFAAILTGGTVSVGQPEAIDGLSVAAGAMLSLARFPFTVAGSIDNAGLILDGTTLVVAGAVVTLDGGGTVALSGASDSSAITAASLGDTLVNAGAVIAGTGTIGAGGLALTNGAGGVIDAATLSATAATLAVGSGGLTMANAGLMEATTGTLTLQGAISIANFGTIAAAGGTVEVSDALISGGTVTSSGAGQIVVVNSALDGAVAPLVNTGILDIIAADVVGTIANQGSIAGGTLLVPGTLTLMGGGAVSNPLLVSTTSVGVLVNVDNAISKGGFGVDVTNDAAGVISNSTFPGLIRLNGTGDVEPVVAVNYGTIEDATIDGLLTDEPGGTIVSATIDAYGGTLDLEGGTLEGQSTFSASGGVGTTSGTLDGSVVPVTNGGSADVLSNGIDLLGALKNAGTISTQGNQYFHYYSVGVYNPIVIKRAVGSPGGQLVVASPTVSLTGNGQVQLLGSPLTGAIPFPLGAISAAATGEVLVNVDNTISGDEGIGAGGLVLDNQAAGVIEATSGSMTLDPLSLANAGILEANGGTLAITTGIYTDLTGSWIAVNSTIGLPGPNGFAGIAGDLVLEGTAAEFVSSTGTNLPPLTNSYLAPQTILAGGALAVFSGATFGIALTPSQTIVVGGNTIVSGNSLQPFGNGGLLELAAGTADLVAAVTNIGTMSGYGSLTVSGAVMNNAGGTIEANGGLLTFQGALSGGQILVDADATLELSSGWFGGGGAIPVSFDAGNDLLQIDVTDNAGSFSNVGSVAVNNFVYGDTIVVDGTVAGGGAFPGFDSITNDGTTLAFIEGGQTLGTFGFAGGTSHLVLSQDANHDEIITTSAYTWTGTSGADWSVAGDWSPAGGPPGITDGAIVLAGGTVNVGEAQSIDVLSLAAGAMLSIATGIAFTVAGSIDNGGAIFDVGTLVVAGPSVTLSGGGAIGLTGTADTSALLAASTGDGLVNVNDTISGAGALGGGSLGLTNEAGGVIDALAFFAAPATLDVDVAGTLVNAGLIEATTGALNISDPIANSGTVDATGNALTLNDGADNSGLIDAAAGTIALQGTVSNNGTITVTGGTLDLTGVLDNSAGMIEVGSGAADLNGTIENASTITASGGTFELQGTVNNAGGIINANAGTLDLHGTVLNTGLISATSGEFDLAGHVNNAGGTIASVDGAITLDAVTISGGELAGTFSASGAPITLDGSATPIIGSGITNPGAIIGLPNYTSLTMLGTLDNVGITLDSGSVGTVATQSVLLTSGSVLSLTSTPGYTFYYSHPPTFIPAKISTIEPAAAGDVLTNLDGTIHGGGKIFGQLVNGVHGLIQADWARYGLDISGTIGNYGLMESTTNVLNLGGVINQYGVGTIEGAGDLSTGDPVAIAGTVVGGTLAGPIQFQFGASTLDGSTGPVTNLGLVEGGSISLLGSINNAGTFTGNEGEALIVASPTVTLTGAGQVETDNQITSAATGDLLVNIDNTIIAAGGGDVGGGGMLALDNQSAGLVEGGNGGLLDPLSLTNEGTVEATTGTLTVNTASLTNTGTMEANGGTLVLASSTASNLTGTWVAVNGPIVLPSPGNLAEIAGTIVLEGTAAAFISSSGTGTPPLTNSYLAPETILAGGTLAVLTGATFGIDRTPGGTIVVGGTTYFGGSLLPFGNAGLLQLGGGTADLMATVSNTGTLFGNGSLITAGAVMNNAGGTVEANGGLLTFQGALSGGQLLVDAGATLELSSGWFGGGGAIPVSFDAGGDLLRIDVTDNAGTFSNVGSVAVNNFVYGDTIAVVGTVAGGGAFPGFSSVTNDGTTLAFIEGGQTLGTLGFAGGTAHVLLNQDANHDEILTVACFAAGTHLLTHAGEVAVEALRIGDTLPTLRGSRGTVRWLGYRQIDCRHHPRPHEVWPIRVEAGAFGPGLPLRDLLLSPDHAVYVDAVLIPIRYLLNGASIKQVETAEVTYWHVELDRHAVILAEGLPAESYLDTGNRAAFANGGDAIGMHADFARGVWRENGCAPLVVSGPRIAQARAMLLARAADLGHASTDDVELRLIVDGRVLPAEVDGRTWRVRLPATGGTVRLVSRASVPAHMQAEADDHRVLGVAVARICLDGQMIALDDPRMTSGWHGLERGADWRWTDGDAQLAVAGVRRLAFDVVMGGHYWVAGRVRCNARAAPMRSS